MHQYRRRLNTKDYSIHTRLSASFSSSRYQYNEKKQNALMLYQTAEWQKHNWYETNTDTLIFEVCLEQIRLNNNCTKLPFNQKI